MLTITVICECDSWTVCGKSKSIQLSLEEAQEILQEGLVVIIDDCQNGPPSIDQLVEKKDGYSLYQNHRQKARDD